MLIECDPSIKSIIVNIDSDNHDFIIEDLDEERVVVKENMVPLLKQKLEDVRFTTTSTFSPYELQLTIFLQSASGKISPPSMNQVPNNTKYNTTHLFL